MKGDADGRVKMMGQKGGRNERKRLAKNHVQKGEKKMRPKMRVFTIATFVPGLLNAGPVAADTLAIQKEVSQCKGKNWKTN